MSKGADVNRQPLLATTIAVGLGAEDDGCDVMRPGKPESRVTRLRTHDSKFCLLFMSAAAFLVLVAAGRLSAQPTDQQAVHQWTVTQPLPAAVKLTDDRFIPDREVSLQRLTFACSKNFQPVELRLTQPPALIIDDLEARVSVRATGRGVRFGLQVVVPGQKDPRTGRTLRTVIYGEQQDTDREWQVLTMRLPASQLHAKTRELRSQFNRPDISMAGAYVDGCVLSLELHRGISQIEIGDCRYGPIVKPDSVAVADSRHERQEQTRASGRLRIDRDKVTFQSRPLFPRFMPDHGESVMVMSQTGANMLWVPQLHSTQRMQELIDHNFFVMATPPHPEFDPADFSTPLHSLSPLEQTSPLPDIWYLGTAIQPEQLPHLLAWAKEVRSADRILRRPLMADLAGSEGVASRHIDSVGISQNSLGQFSPFGMARNRSFIRQNSSAQLTIPWEWIQTEHSGHFQDWRQRTGSVPAFVEPEQIVMQLAACLSAGCRGIGFWKTRRLDSGAVRDLETTRAIELATLYVQILEPLLIDGKVDGHVPIEPGEAREQKQNQSFLDSVFGSSTIPATQYNETPQAPDAAIINLAGTSLILAAYWDQASQFVPQTMYTNSASLTVNATETASAWQVTPTSVRGYRRNPVPGGLRLELDDFDQLSVVVVTADHTKRQQLQQRVQRHAERAAQLFVELASLKLARVRQTAGRINDLKGSDSKSTELLDDAADKVAQAQSFVQRRQFQSAEQFARTAMRQMRIVQNRYWYRAVQSLPTPTASPHTVSFSTLPDHWELMHVVEAASPSGNLMPSGNFESNPGASDNYWKPVIPRPRIHHAAAEVVTDRAGRNHIMRMRAWNRPAAEPSNADHEPALLLQCPPIEVQQGDVLEISGRIRAGQGIHSTEATPFIVFDSDLGQDLGVTPRLEPSWRTFRMFRQASESGPFQIWLGVRSPAEVYIDDLSVKRRPGDKSRGKTADQLPNAARTVSQAGSSRVQGAGYANPSFP